MPQLGEIRKGFDAGLHYGGNVIWHACEDCGRERWVQLRYGIAVSRRCKVCCVKGIGNKNLNWRGGRRKTNKGYILVWLPSNDFFHSMCNAVGYVAEHRLVVAKALGRCLHRWEIVHHKEGFAKDDNRYPETLQLVGNDRHNQITILKNRIEFLERKVINLQNQIKALKEKQYAENEGN